MTNLYDALIAQKEAERKAIDQDIADLKRMRGDKAAKPTKGKSVEIVETTPEKPKKQAQAGVKLTMLRALEAGNESSTDIQAFLAANGIEKEIGTINSVMWSYKKADLVKNPDIGVYVLASAGKKYLKANQDKA
jgi:hypothetical protein